jgi:hypothetical protein
MQRVWLRVVLAAGAGLASLVVCSGAVVVIIRLFVASINFHWIGSSLDPPLFWLGFSAAMLFAGASLSLPPLALGAREGHALKATLLSGLCFCAFVFIFFVFGHGLFSGASHIIDGAGWDLGRGFAGCCPTRRPSSCPYDWSYADHGVSYLLCFVVHLLDCH